MTETSAPNVDALEIAPGMLLRRAGSERHAGGPKHAPATASGRPGADAQSESCACPGVYLDVLTDLTPLEREWRSFEAEADCTAFQCFGWAAKWQKNIGDRKRTCPAIVVGRDVDGTLLFIFPLAIERRWPARRLTWLASELCDYNGPMLSRRFSEHVHVDRFPALWDEVLRLLPTEPRLRFDLIDLPKMTVDVDGQANPFMALAPALGPSGAHLGNLGKSWDSFYAARRSSSTRKRERRQFKRLADFGDMRFVEPKEKEDIERTLEALFAQKATSFARMGVENFLERPGHKEFFREIATDPEERAFTHVSRLDVGATMAGTSFGLSFRGRYYLLLSSYQDGELSRFGPGRAHLQELLRRAIDNGMVQFDFTVGDEPYKRDWSDVTMPLYGYFAATTPMGWPVVMATLAFRRVKRAIKQNPFLWRIFNKARQRKAAASRWFAAIESPAHSAD